MNDIKGISFLNINNINLNALFTVNLDNFQFQGTYFLLAKLFRRDVYICIYVGQSATSIKDRLLDHKNKFQNRTHLWYDWLNYHYNENLIVRNIYFFYIETIFGIILETYLIKYDLSNNIFPLNIQYNGHKNLIIINTIHYKTIDINIFIHNLNNILQNLLNINEIINNNDNYII